MIVEPVKGDSVLALMKTFSSADLWNDGRRHDGDGRGRGLIRAFEGMDEKATYAVGTNIVSTVLFRRSRNCHRHQRRSPHPPKNVAKW